MPDVVGVWRDGGYGTTVWFHELSCGHIVTGRRRSPKPVLPCAVCDQLAALPPEEDFTVAGVDFDRPVEPAPNPDETARLLEQEVLLRLRLASTLGVTPDSVAVVETALGPAAVVTLFPAQVEEILTRS